MKQKGLSSIYIVVGIIILGLITFALYTFSSSQKQSPADDNQSQPTPETESNLEKVESQTYALYYPKGYTKSDEKIVSGSTVITYYPPNRINTREGMRLIVEPLQTRMETPSTEFCEKALKFMLRSTKNVRVVEAKPVDYIESHGCRYHYVDDSVEGKLIGDEKHLWFKERDDIHMYRLAFFYLNSQTQQEKEDIQQAIDKFMIK